MEFHGEDITPGDRVYDIVDGFATVSRIDAASKGVFVNFDSNSSRTVKYDGEGRRGGRAMSTLFWHNPVFCVPPKNGARWSHKRKTLVAVFDNI